MDRGAWWATVHGVSKSRTWLSNWAHSTWLWFEMLLFENDRKPVSGDFKYIGACLFQVTGESEASTWGCSMPPTRARLSPLPFLARCLGSSPHPWSGPCSGQREVEGAKYRKGHSCLFFFFFNGGDINFYGSSTCRPLLISPCMDAAWWPFSGEGLGARGWWGLGQASAVFHPNIKPPLK